MADHKLSYTAEEVDELLGKVKSGVCLPVVKLETAIGEGQISLSDSDTAKLNECCEKVTPIIIECHLSDGENAAQFACVANVAHIGIMKIISGDLGGTGLTIQDTGSGNWVARIDV